MVWCAYAWYFWGPQNRTSNKIRILRSAIFVAAGILIHGECIEVSHFEFFSTNIFFVISVLEFFLSASFSLFCSC